MSNRFFPGPLSSGMALSDDEWHQPTSGTAAQTRDWRLSMNRPPLNRPHLWLVHSTPCQRTAANDSGDRRQVNDLLASRY
jgi:hypothetical protein